MKRAISAFLVLAAGVVFADVVSSSNVIGLLPVSSATKRTIVSVPWCAMSATDDAAIQVSNLVKTANLTVGDMLHYVNSDGSYLSWRLAGSEVKYWESVNIATDKSVSVSPDSHDQTVARGNCIVLIRQDCTNGTAKTFYLYGQLGTNTAVKTQVFQGTDKSPAYTLIASPSVSGWSVNDITWSGVNEKDMISIMLPSGKQRTLTPKEVSSAWTWGSMTSLYDETTMSKTGSVWTAYSTAIPAGQGAWYISYGGNPEINWSGDAK